MRVAGFLIGLIVLAGGAAAGGAEPGLPQDLDGMCDFLGAPVRPERGRQAWDLVREQEPEVAERFAVALGACGGVGALGPLLDLMRDRDAAVRTAALHAVGRVGLRQEKVLGRLRDVLRWRQGAERQAAMLALGRIGDARDFDVLLDFGLDPEDSTATAAFRALAELSGVRLPPVYARWSYWWRSTRRRLQTDLVAALAAIEDAPDAETANVHRDTVGRGAWADIAGVQARLDLWLRASDDDLRRHAVHLIGELGICSLTTRLERLRLFAGRDETLGQAIDEVLRKMGLEFPPEPVEDTPAESESENEPGDGSPEDPPRDDGAPPDGEDETPEDAPSQDEPADNEPADDAPPSEADEPSGPPGPRR